MFQEDLVFSNARVRASESSSIEVIMLVLEKQHSTAKVSFTVGVFTT